MDTLDTPLDPPLYSRKRAISSRDRPGCRGAFRHIWLDSHDYELLVVLRPLLLTTASIRYCCPARLSLEASQSCCFGIVSMLIPSDNTASPLTTTCCQLVTLS